MDKVALQEKDINHDSDEEEIYEIIKSSALLKGLDNTSSNKKLKPIAQ
jgi:hypothetical protein